jgi:hypothetical protein
VEIIQGGRPLTLALKQAHVALAQPVAPAGPVPENPDGNRGDRPADGREGMRGRGQGTGNGEGPPMVRNLPPEAQAMIQEFRRRRAERANQGVQPQGQPQAATPNRQP